MGEIDRGVLSILPDRVGTSSSNQWYCDAAQVGNRLRAAFLW